MLHKIASNSHPAVFLHPATSNPNPAGLSLVPRSLVPPSLVPTTPHRQAADHQPSTLTDLAVITSRRCSSFFAEAAVLVLVFGILDFFILKGRIEASWIVGALGIAIVLLGASIAMDFSAYRWIKSHP